MNTILKLKPFLIITIAALSFNNVLAQVNPIKPMQIDCTVNSVSPTELSAGSAAGQVFPTVTVSTLNNCTGYLIQVSDNWFSVSKNGLDLTVSVTANTGGTRVGYIWLGTLDYPVTVTQGCGGGPGAAGTITGTSTVCRGQSNVEYSVSPISGATGYSWTLPPRTSIASGDNTNHIYVNYFSNAGSGSITVTGTNSCASGQPSPDYPVTVAYIAQPGTISGTTSACQGGTYTYSVSPVSGASSYTWTLPYGASGSSSTNSIDVTFNGTNSGTISVIANNSTGCVSTPSSLAISIITLNQYNVSGGGAICPGSPVAISLSGSTSGVQYKCFLNGVDLHTPVFGTGSAISFGPYTIEGTYTIKGVSPEGCEVPMNGSAVITLRLPSTPANSINASLLSVCPGGSSTLIVVGGSLELGYGSWKWYSGSTLIGTGPSIPVSPLITTIYSVRAEGGCITTSSVYITIVVKDAPSISTQPQNSTIVLNQDASFSVTATGTNLQYQWQASINGNDPWADLSGLPAVGYQTSTLIIRGSTTFEDKFYRCRITSDCGFIIHSDSVRILLSFPASGYLTGYNIPDPETRALNTSSYLVGSSNGSVSIDAMGGSSYYLPLEVPSGVNGLTPNLSLGYSSNSGSGLAGFGWQINGISTISLGARKAYLDDPDIDNFDRFYLDGQRLQPNLSYSGYGEQDTQYQTENDIFTRVTPQSTDPVTGPTWFKAETKSGLIFEYGNTSSSRVRISGTSKVTNWYVSKISDLFGNMINFSYIQDHFSVYPSEITYGPNTITFSYKQRSDINRYLVGAATIEQWLLLDKIVLRYNSTIVKTYEFKQSYQGSNYNSSSILNEIIEYGIGSSRLNSTVFSYQIPENVMFQQTMNTTHSDLNGKSKLFPGDFNGDGKADLLCVPDVSKGATWTGMKVYFGDGADNFANPISSSISLDLTKLRDLRIMDLNTDGKDDILYEYTNSQDPSISDFNYILCDGLSLSQPVTFISQVDDGHTGMTGKARRNNISQEDDNERSDRSLYSHSLGKNNLSSNSPLKNRSSIDSDFNGDGKNDVFINDPIGHCQIWCLNSLGQMTRFFNATFLYGVLCSDVLSADFNGDGYMDLWSFTNTGLEIYSYDGGSGNISRIYNSPDITNQYFFTLGDFNADGKEDLFLYGNRDNNGVEHDWPEWLIKLSTGAGFEAHSIPQKKSNLKNDYVRTGDFNGDGANDIMVTSIDLSWSGTYFYISSNNGTDLVTSTLSGYSTSIHNFYLADYNGDGSTDLFCTDFISPGPGYQVYKTLGKTSILMDKTANGLGVLTKLNYTNLSQAPLTIYKRGIGATYPVAEFQGPWSVVSSIQVDNGKGSLNTQNYYYEGARIHLRGKGFIGFAKTSVSDLSSGIETGNVQSYNISNSYPFYFYPTLIKSYSKLIGANDTIQRVSNTWSQVVLEAMNQRIYPYIQSSIQVNKLTDQSVTTSTQYDNYGNPTVMTRSYLNGPTETSSNSYENLINQDHWLLGRPTVTTIQFTGSSPLITRSGTRIFDPNNNHLTSETWYAGTGNQISKTYAYNSNGTFQSETATSNGVSRSNSCTYMADNIRVYTSTDQLSHTSTNAYDNYGRLYTQQDYLGNMATYLYDDLGRTTSSSLSDGSQTTTVYAWEVPTSDPLQARYSIQKTGNDGSQAKSWFDKLGREIRSDSKGFDGTMIYTSTSYNTKGQVESVSDPYYSNGSALLNTFLYDSYGRKTNLSRPSGKNSTWVYNNNMLSETTAGKLFSKTYSADGTLSSATDAGGTINYSYYNDGKVKTITAPGGIVTSMHYDIAGNQDTLIDKSAGKTSYGYNGFGQLTDQRNSRGQTTHLTYFSDGRLSLNTSSAEGITTYSYNSNKQMTGISSPGSVSRTLAYDTYGRLITNTETIPGSTALTTSFTYDTKGRIGTITHPSGIIEINNYNTFGYLNSVSTGGTVRWLTTGMNARQQVTAGQYWQSGGNMIATFGYDIYGYPTSTVAGTKQNYLYTFNPITGNLTTRQNAKYTGLTENFTYDNLDRLHEGTKGGTTTIDMAYDGTKGGITTKIDAGTFLYNTTARPYAMSSINPKTTLTPSASQTITYTSFGSVNTIAENNYTATFLYNSDNDRAKMLVKQGTSTILTRWYSTSSYIKETAGSTTKEYTFIGGDSYTAPIVAITQSGTTTYYNLLRDYLGSITHVINATTKAVTAEYSYDAWGRMRNSSTWAVYAPGSEPALFVAGRGYTGHEHLPWFNLINMNGRVYDALVGMFLSPDNYVQDPGFTQSFNRYGYCFNNPLKFTDPSGMLATMRDEGDAAFNDYFSWLCDASMSFGNMFGGGGGRGARLDGAAGWDRDASSSRMAGVRWNGLRYVDRLTYDEVSYNEVYNKYIIPNSITDCTFTIQKNGFITHEKNYGGVKGLTLNSYWGLKADKNRPEGSEIRAFVVIDISYASTKGEWEQLVAEDGQSPRWDSFDGSSHYPNQEIIGDVTWMRDQPARDRKNVDLNFDTFYVVGGKIIVHLTWGFSIVNGNYSIKPLLVLPTYNP
jgi:RHS repeat-associated protein